MGKFLVITSLAAVVIGVGVYYMLWCSPPPPLPTMDLERWWGPGARTNKPTTVTPFQIRFEETMIRDLKERLSRRRKFTPPLEGVGFEYGFNTNYLEKVLDYWQNKYDFAKRQEFLNQFPQFKTNIQGLDIHFLHVKPSTEAAKNGKHVPLLLLHGWPGSVREFYEVIPHLVKLGQQNKLAFELIVPSLPGYGFSSAAARPGLGATDMAVVMRNLMHRLGHKKFYVQGGDWGSVIGSNMATLFQEEVLGYHTNMPSVMTDRGNVMLFAGAWFPSLIADSGLEERTYPLSKHYSFLLEESGYMHLQSTKPDTVGVGVNDSPAGLAAYILEKFSTWTVPDYKKLPDGGLLKKFTLDQLIDNLMLYWSTNSITTSFRLYAETMTKKEFGLNVQRIPTKVPTAVIQGSYELMFTPQSIIKTKFTNLAHYKALNDGGHFLAFELPEIFSEDLVAAIKVLINFKPTA